jgi:ribosomal protein S18 acetylase RimI-like enzyme
MTQIPFKIRAYTDQDREACLSVFDSNLPTFFAPDERMDFELYLDDLAERGENAEYLVLETSAGILACGGYHVNNNQAGLAWGMVTRDHHRQGIGLRLILERLRRIAAQPEITSIILDTSQHSQGFFARLGFEVVQILENNYAIGLHRIDMKLELDSSARNRILETK